MYKLFIIWIKWTFLGRILKSIKAIPLFLFCAPNTSFTFLEYVWHYSSPKLLKTLYFNFRLCKFKEALRCPIFIYGRTRLWNLSGTVEFTTDKIEPGMVRWGYDWGYRSNGDSVIRIEGTVKFGGQCLIVEACNIAVFSGAELSIGGGGKITENVFIYCQKSIQIGNNCSITYQTSIMDTDFHYMLNTETKEIYPKAVPIVIGDNVWIGNRASIKKGTVVPSNTTIAASYSVLTKDYSGIPPHSILGGCPAKVIATSVSRTWRNEMQTIKRLDQWFMNNPNENKYKLSADEHITDYLL